MKKALKAVAAIVLLAGISGAAAAGEVGISVDPVSGYSALSDAAGRIGAAASSGDHAGASGLLNDLFSGRGIKSAPVPVYASAPAASLKSADVPEPSPAEVGTGPVYDSEGSYSMVREDELVSPTSGAAAEPAGSDGPKTMEIFLAGLLGIIIVIGLIMLFPPAVLLVA